MKDVTPSGIIIDFDEEKHAYHIDGERFANVTTILGCVDKSGPLMGWVEKVTLEGVTSLLRDDLIVTERNLPNLLKNQGLSFRDVRDTAATRGTSIHDALEVLARDGTSPLLDQYPEEDRGYVTGLAKWWLDHRPKALHVEMLVASLEHRYAGKLDLVCEIQGVTHMVDLKTSKRVYETHHLQLAGYELAYLECGYQPTPTVTAILRVGEDGSYDFVPSKADAADWLNVVGLYETLKKMRRKPKLEKAA